MRILMLPIHTSRNGSQIYSCPGYRGWYAGHIPLYRRWCFQAPYMTYLPYFVCPIYHTWYTGNSFLAFMYYLWSTFPISPLPFITSDTQDPDVHVSYMIHIPNLASRIYRMWYTGNNSLAFMHHIWYTFLISSISHLIHKTCFPHVHALYMIHLHVVCITYDNRDIFPRCLCNIYNEHSHFFPLVK